MKKLEVTIKPFELDDVREALAAQRILESAASMGPGADDTIVVLPVDEVIRIRTGERGEHAIDRGAFRSGRAA